jgi:hypothetical protein
MQEGIQLPELLARIKVLREARLRAEHVAFSFMKRRAEHFSGFSFTLLARRQLNATRRSLTRSFSFLVFTTISST